MATQPQNARKPTDKKIANRSTQTWLLSNKAPIIKILKEAVNKQNTTTARNVDFFMFDCLESEGTTC